ncbi:MAG: class I SAM-dependent methyltransferase [Acidimicrobiia bacterium]
MSETSGFQVGDEAPRHYQDVATPFMIPMSEAMVDAVVRSGDAVLDVACGTGIATRIAATAAGNNGSVVGSDINTAMLAIAQSISAERQDGLSWDEASALDLPYAADRFDAAICQQGAQFFPDPVAGLTEIARVVRPGGRIGATVWSDMIDSPYLLANVEIPIQMLGQEPDSVVFTSTADEMTSWFDGAGLTDVVVEKVIVDVSLPPLAEYFPAHMKALPWGEAFFAVAPEVRAAAMADLDERMADYRTPTGVTVPFASWLATGTV